MANELVVRNGVIVNGGTVTVGTVGSGGFSLPTTDGTAGQFLKTDGNGGVTFADGSGASAAASYLVLSGDASLSNERSLALTANELSAVDGGANGTYTISLADNTVMPGTSGMVVPVGNTAQEVGTTNGMIRYNSQTNEFRAYQNGAWVNMINTNTGTVTSVAATQPAEGLTITGSPITTNGTLVFALANDLAGLEGLTTTGLSTRTADDTWTTVTLTGTSDQIAITNGDGVAGNPTFAIADNAILPGTGSVTVPAGTTLERSTPAGNGMIRYNTDNNVFEVYQNGAWINMVGNGTVTSVDLTQPAEGITVSGGPITTSGSITLTLSDDLEGLEGLTTTGFAVRDGSSSWITRTITGTANEITVTNGDGVANGPAIAIAANAVLPGTGAMTVPSGTTAEEPGTPTDGMIRYNTDTNKFEAYENGAWVNMIGASSGISNVVEDTTPQLGGDLDVNGHQIVSVSNANVIVNPNGTGKFEVNGVTFSKKQTQAIADAQTNTVFFSFVAASNEFTVIDYALKRTTDGSRIGTLMIINDGTSVSISDTGADIASCGVTFTAVVNGANIDVRYSSTSTTHTGSMSYYTRQMDV